MDTDRRTAKCGVVADILATDPQVPLDLHVIVGEFEDRLQRSGGRAGITAEHLRLLLESGVCLEFLGEVAPSVRVRAHARRNSESG